MVELGTGEMLFACASVAAVDDNRKIDVSAQFNDIAGPDDVTVYRTQVQNQAFVVDKTL